MILTKQQFTEELVGKIDELYEAYLAAETAPDAGKTTFPHADADLGIQEPQPFRPKYTPEELQVEIDKLAKEAGAERIALKIGKIAITIAMAAVKAG